MKKGILRLIILLIVTGCASIDSIHQKYARINTKDGITEVEAKLMAQMNLLEAKKENEFELFKPTIDYYPGIPEGRDYIFILFAPKTNRENADQQKKHKYLVVINPLFGAIAYFGEFDPTKGNYHFRYLNIIRDIQKRITVTP